jgi:NAD(P)-dependent dehydrogenase (short-subunit alcohol dehydrogenase family)
MERSLAKGVASSRVVPRSPAGTPALVGRSPSPSPEGADILISYLPEEEDDARETARWVEQVGRRVVLVPGDIADQHHCKSIVERAVSEFGRLDILINNAAFQRTYEKIEDINADEWDRAFRVNVHAMFYLSQGAVPHMRPGAAIVNTTSIQSKDPSPQLLAYASTKARSRTSRLPWRRCWQSVAFE